MDARPRRQAAVNVSYRDADSCSSEEVEFDAAGSSRQKVSSKNSDARRGNDAKTSSVGAPGSVSKIRSRQEKSSKQPSSDDEDANTTKGSPSKGDCTPASSFFSRSSSTRANNKENIAFSNSKLQHKHSVSGDKASNSGSKSSSKSRSNKVIEELAPRRSSRSSSSQAISYSDQLSDVSENENDKDDRGRDDDDVDDSSSSLSENPFVSDSNPSARKKGKNQINISGSSKAKVMPKSREKGSRVKSSLGGNGVEVGDSSGDDDEEDNMQYRIQYVLGKKSMPQLEWKKITDSMNSKETIRGSIWTQSDEEYFDNSNVPVEKFLIKWAHASFLHVSWENERDLNDMVGPSAKSHLKRFHKREALRISLFEDLRIDEYFLPAFTQIERVLDIDDASVNVFNIDWERAKLPIFPTSNASNDLNVKLPALIVGDLSASSTDSSSATAGTGEDIDSSISAQVDEWAAAVAMTIDESKNDGDAHGGLVDSSDDEAKVQHEAARGGEVEGSRTSSRLTRGSLKPAPPAPSLRTKAKQVANEDLHGSDCWFLIKWHGISYSESTIEHVSDLGKAGVYYEAALRAFYRREQLPPANSKALREGSSRSLNKDLMSDVQPAFNNGGILRDYQWEGVRWLLFNWSHRRNCILADEMGLGKTIQTATFLQLLKSHQDRRGPFLVVAPLSTIINWQREVQAWCNVDVIVYHGSNEDRDIIVEKEFHYSNDRHKGSYKLEIVVTTPEVCLLSRELSSIHWDAVVIDEAHKLKNYDSKISTTLRDDFKYECCLLLTGTPLQNNMEELWTLLNFVARKEFSDKESFMELYGNMQTSNQLETLYKHIKPYLLRREKNIVEKNVPPKKEVVIEVEMTVPQKQYYRALIEEKTGFLYKGGGKDGPSLTNLAMELRKCCNHPFLIKGAQNVLKQHFDNQSPVEVLVNSSGKLILLDKLLPKLKADGHRVLIFSQFRMMLNIIEDYIDAKGYVYERVDGAVTGSKRQAAIDRYTVDANKELFIMLLSTRAGGVGINLTAADTVIIFDSDWNPQNDIQAQARAHRIGQTRAVTVYRLLTRKTYETAMFQAASMKLGLDYAIMHKMNKGSQQLEGISTARADTASSISKKELENLLKHGAYDIFKEEREGQSLEESKKFCDEDIDEILQRSSILVHEEDKDAALVSAASGPSSLHRGGSLSKATFVSGDGGEGLAIDDPEFWEKVVGISHEESLEDLGSTRKCKLKVGSYKEPSAAQFREAFASSSDDDEEKRERSPRGKREEEKIVLERATWTPENTSKLITLLCNFGYTNWDLLCKGDNIKLNFFKRDIIIGSKWVVLQLLLQSSLIVSSSSPFSSSNSEAASSFEVMIEGNEDDSNKKEKSPRNKDKDREALLLGKYDLEYLDQYIKKNKLVKHVLTDLLSKHAEKGTLALEDIYPEPSTASSSDGDNCSAILADESRMLADTCNISYSKTETDIYELFEEKLSSSVTTSSTLSAEDSSIATTKDRLAAFLSLLIKSTPLPEIVDESASSNQQEEMEDKSAHQDKTLKLKSNARAKLALAEELFAIKLFSCKVDALRPAFASIDAFGSDGTKFSKSADVWESAGEVTMESATNVEGTAFGEVPSGGMSMNNEDSEADQVEGGFDYRLIYDKLNLASYAPNWMMLDDMICMSLVSKIGWPDSKRRFIQFMDQYKTEKLAQSISLSSDSEAAAAIDEMFEYATFSKFLVKRIREIAKAMESYCNPKVKKEKPPREVKEKVEKPPKIVECNPKKLFNSVIETFKEYGRPFDYVAAETASFSSNGESEVTSINVDFNSNANVNQFSWTKFIELCAYDFVTEEYCVAVCNALDSNFQAFIDNLEIKESDVISGEILDGHKYSMVESLVERMYHLHQLRAIFASCNLPVATTFSPLSSASSHTSSSAASDSSSSSSSSMDSESMQLEPASNSDALAVAVATPLCESESSIGDALLLSLISKHCKGLGETVPLFKRDTTMPVWWTSTHDIKLLKFLIQNGLSWKKVCSDPVLTSARSDFVMPSKAGHSTDKDELILILTPKIAEKRFMHIIQSVFASPTMFLSTKFGKFSPEYIDRKMKGKDAKGKSKAGSKLQPNLANRTFGQMPSWVLSVKNIKAPSSVNASSNSSSSPSSINGKSSCEDTEDVAKGPLKRAHEEPTISSPTEASHDDESSSGGKKPRSNPVHVINLDGNDAAANEFGGNETGADASAGACGSEGGTSLVAESSEMDNTSDPSAHDHSDANAAAMSVSSSSSNDGSVESSNVANDSSTYSTGDSESNESKSPRSIMGSNSNVDNNGNSISSSISQSSASTTKKTTISLPTSSKGDKGDKITPLKKKEKPVVTVVTSSATKTPQSIAAFPDWLLGVKNGSAAKAKAKEESAALPPVVDLTDRTDVASTKIIEGSLALGEKRALVRTLTDAGWGNQQEQVQMPLVEAKLSYVSESLGSSMALSDPGQQSALDSDAIDNANLDADSSSKRSKVGESGVIVLDDDAVESGVMESSTASATIAKKSEKKDPAAPAKTVKSGPSHSLFSFFKKVEKSS